MIIIIIIRVIITKKAHHLIIKYKTLIFKERGKLYSVNY